jgi:hypothetical protein
MIECPPPAEGAQACEPPPTPNTDELFDALKTLGAGEFAHLNSSLAQHLIGTEALLRQWQASAAICRAGLFHATYGTAGFDAELVPLSLRHQIAKLIGSDAEALVYLFCACDREHFYPRIGTTEQHRFTDRFRGEELILSDEQLCALCEITLANELQIAAESATFRQQYGAELSELFERMRGLVSETGFQAYRQLLFAN